MGIASGIEADRTAYQELLARSRQRSVFAQSWWLDAVTGSPDGWRANLLRDEAGAARAAWPLAVRATAHGTVGTGAPYTPFLGPLLPDRARGGVGVGGDVQLLEQLAALLADHAHVEAACMPELDYWTPLSWHGYAQTSRTTWRIGADTPPEQVRAGMRTNRRRALARAEKEGLVVATGSVADLLSACDATFVAQGRERAPARDVLERVARASLDRGHGQVLAVRTSDGMLASAGLFVWDDRWTWNLANGTFAQLASTGAPTALMYRAIEHALGRGTGFDFEGSMIRPIERFVREFGGEPVAYSVVRRSSPRWERAVARRRLVKRVLRR